MNRPDIEKLETTAKAATCNVEWKHDINTYEGDKEEYHCVIGPGHIHTDAIWFDPNDAEHIATANPRVILDICKYVKELESQLKKADDAVLDATFNGPRPAKEE